MTSQVYTNLFAVAYVSVGHRHVGTTTAIFIFHGFEDSSLAETFAEKITDATNSFAEKNSGEHIIGVSICSAAPVSNVEEITDYKIHLEPSGSYGQIAQEMLGYFGITPRPKTVSAYVAMGYKHGSNIERKTFHFPGFADKDQARNYSLRFESLLHRIITVHNELEHHLHENLWEKKPICCGKPPKKSITIEPKNNLLIVLQKILQHFGINISMKELLTIFNNSQ